MYIRGSINEIDNCINQLLNLESEKIDLVVNENYNIITEKLDINKNVYTLEDYNTSYNENFEDIFNTMLKTNNIIGKEMVKNYEKVESNYKEHIEYKEWMEKQLKDKEDELENINSKLNKSFLVRLYRKLKNKK